MPKFAYEEVLKIFEERGFILLEEKYTNSGTPLRFVCTCGNEGRISIDVLRRGAKCRKCAGNYKPSYLEVSDYFKENGCVLLSDSYKGAHGRLQYQCSCGNISFIAFSDFKNGKRCMKCKAIKMAERNRHDYKYVRDVFEQHGCTLLDKTYINGEGKLKYICKCGNVSERSFNKFREHPGCKICNITKLTEEQKLTLDEVKLIFSEKNCTLISDSYVNANAKLQYKCNECGYIGEVYLLNFKRSWGCRACSINYRIGENHPNWNPEISDEERIVGRNIPEYDKWRDDVYKRDGYVCVICHQKGYLNAHHLDGYHWCKERRVDISNGVTLCDLHHEQFHEMYGRKNNTEQQFIEFILQHKLTG